MKFDPQVVASFDLSKSAEVNFYYDFYNGRIWANVRRFAKSQRYTGPTTDGIKFDPKHLPEIIQALEKAYGRRDTMSDEEFLRLPKNKSHDLVVHASFYKGTVGIDLREWYRTSEGKEGWGRGIRLGVEHFSDLINSFKLMNQTEPNLKELGDQEPLDFAQANKKLKPIQVDGIPDHLKRLFMSEDDHDQHQSN